MLPDAGAEIAVGGRDHAEVGFQSLIASETFELLILQNTQQFGLQSQRNLTDLVQEQSAFIGQFETAYLSADGTGERAFFIAEKVAFQKGRRE